MLLISFLLFGVQSVCSIALPQAASIEDPRNISAIYQAALGESGTLQIAWGGDETNQYLPFANAFETAFPGIKIDVTVDLSKYLDGRINYGLIDGTPYADVAVLQTLHDFDLWKARDVLLEYKPPGFGQLYRAVTDTDGAFLPARFSSFGSFTYDPTRVEKADLPETYLDILDPKWKGKLVLSYPNDDDAISYLFSLIISKYGWEWLDKLQEQDVKWVRGTASGAEVINLPGSQYTLSFTSYPLGNLSTAPASDYFMSWAQTSAIFKATKLPETAKLVQAFLASEDFQNAQVAQGGFSTRKDAAVNSTIWTSGYTDPVQFHQFMLQRNTVEAWRFLFEDKLGTAQGLSPLIDDLE